MSTSMPPARAALPLAGVGVEDDVVLVDATIERPSCRDSQFAGDSMADGAGSSRGA
jgi:hypothetical protein